MAIDNSHNDDNLPEGKAQAHAELKRLDPNAHSNLASATAGLNEAGTSAIINRKIENAQREIETAQEERTSDHSITPDTQAIENEALLNQKAEEEEKREEGFDDVIFLTLDHQIEDLNNEIAALRTEQIAVAQKLDTIDQNIDALWTRLESEGKTEELEILGDRAAGKPLVVVNATLEGGAEGQSYVVYEDETKGLYIKNPQDQSPVYVKDLNDPQINQDIADQRDRFGQQFGNENQDLATRFEQAESKYQANPTLRNDLESAIRNQETGEIEQFSSYVRQDEISEELADKQTQITALKTQAQQIAATGVVNTETPDTLNFDRDFDAEAKKSQLTKDAKELAQDVSNHPVSKADILSYLPNDASESDYETFAYALQGEGVKLTDDVWETNDPQPNSDPVNTPEQQPEPQGQQEPAYNPGTPGISI